MAQGHCTVLDTHERWPKPDEEQGKCNSTGEPTIQVRQEDTDLKKIREEVKQKPLNTPQEKNR